jgi:hypothetical protein
MTRVFRTGVKGSKVERGQNQNQICFPALAYHLLRNKCGVGVDSSYLQQRAEDTQNAIVATAFLLALSTCKEDGSTDSEKLTQGLRW